MFMQTIFIADLEHALEIALLIGIVLITLRAYHAYHAIWS
jgi:hypothetical protein